MAEEPTVVRFEIIGVAEGQGFSPFKEPARQTGYEGAAYDDLMSALLAFAEAHPDLKRVVVQIEPGRP
jgi:hypothetical protein